MCTTFRQVASWPSLQGDRKGSPLLYHGSARPACGEFGGGAGNPTLNSEVGVHGRRKRPHPYGYEGASQATS